MKVSLPSIRASSTPIDFAARSGVPPVASPTNSGSSVTTKAKQAAERQVGTRADSSPSLLNNDDISGIDSLLQRNFGRDVAAQEAAERGRARTALAEADNSGRLQAISDNNRAQLARTNDSFAFDLQQSARKSPDISLGQQGRTVTSSSTVNTIGNTGPSTGISSSRAPGSLSFSSSPSPVFNTSQERDPRPRRINGIGFGSYGLDQFAGIVNSPNGGY